MPRTMTPAMLAAIAAKNIQPILFVQIAFPSSVVYMWTGIGTLSWNEQNWQGLGSLMSFTVAEDGATVEARGITITIGGLEPTLFAECINEFRIGLPVTVYFGAFSAGSVIADPLIAWSGRTDQPVYDVAADQVTVSINCESRLIDMNLAVDRRLTHQDQQMTYPEDLGLMFVNGLQEITVFWGQYPNSTNNV